MNTRISLTALGAAALALLAASPALAWSHGENGARFEPRPMFDADEFGRADTNADGQLSADEISAFADVRRAEREAERASRLVERLDGDADGTLSLAEATTPPRPVGMFERLDGDRDGQISRAEFDAAMTKMHQHPHGPMRDGDHGRDRAD